MDRAPVATRVQRSPNMVLAVALGGGFLVAGVIALAITLGGSMASTPGHHAGGYGGLHCCAYLAVGVLLLVGAAKGRAREVNTLVGLTYLVVGVILMAAFDEAPQLLTLHETHNVVHLVSAALLLGFGRTQE